ncbi:MAG: sn-glycerol-3-phosphate ABC transporter ATP-binding protein UgpC [Ignavibacteriae bacterium]|nr:sn-glycerol-3-phosphate ABC transporter ATP-binding protein UgpC [Ignavibacteriota bacterium]
MASVRLESVKKVYDGGQVAVHGMDLDIHDKEFIVLVGPSGCGKSTTLRMIAGLEEVTEGTISIDGQAVNDAPPKDRDIAMVFQNYALYPHMSVYENMAFGLKLRKFPAKEIEQRVHEAASILGIENLLDRKPKALSGGQRQRVALGRAIVRKPKVFLFDEPLSNLDAKLRVQTRTEISKLHHRLAATMVYVTHDQMEAMTLGDRIVVMKDGHVQQIAPPLELYHHPCNKFVAGFIGSPAMNFFSGTLQRKNGVVFHADTNGFQLPVEKKHHKQLSKHIGKSVTLGLRPEHIAPKPSGKAGKAKARVHVEVVEPMGNESLVYFTTGKDSIQYVARLNGIQIPDAGKTLDLAFDMSQAHFFDAATEKVI